jgi:hypothetical protein
MNKYVLLLILILCPILIISCNPISDLDNKGSVLLNQSMNQNEGCINNARSITDKFIASLVNNDLETFKSIGKFEDGVDYYEEFIKLKKDIKPITNISFVKVKENNKSSYIYVLYKGFKDGEETFISVNAYENNGRCIVNGLSIVKLNPRTKILSDDTLAKLISYSDEKITFSETTPELESLSPGDMIVIGITEQTPYGALRKIVSIQDVNNKTIIK